MKGKRQYRAICAVCFQLFFIIMKPLERTIAEHDHMQKCKNAKIVGFSFIHKGLTICEVYFTSLFVN